MKNQNVLLIASGAIFLFIGALSFLYLKSGTKELPNFNHVLGEVKFDAYNAELDDFRKAKTDMQGGFSPEETVALYIDAVSKSDYVRASSYFIEDRKAGELANFEQANREDIVSFVDVVKRLENKMCEDERCTLSAEVAGVGRFYVRFVKYPNGIWKIVEM